MPVPQIDGKTQARLPDRILSTPPDVIIAEGSFLLCSAKIVSMADVKARATCPSSLYKLCCN